MNEKIKDSKEISSANEPYSWLESVQINEVAE